MDQIAAGEILKIINKNGAEKINFTFFCKKCRTPRVIQIPKGVTKFAENSNGWSLAGYYPVSTISPKFGICIFNENKTCGAPKDKSNVVWIELVASQALKTIEKFRLKQIFKLDFVCKSASGECEICNKPEKEEPKKMKMSDENKDECQEILFKFDNDVNFGPAADIKREVRWRRADSFGLNPPQEVMDIINKNPEKYNVPGKRS